MNDDIDNLKKKILYRSSYRGTKEMDKLLGSFTRLYIDNLNPKQLIELENFLNIDDDNLYKYYKGLNTEINFENNHINLLFKNFVFKEK
jgi:antitoxin CptB